MEFPSFEHRFYSENSSKECVRTEILLLKQRSLLPNSAPRRLEAQLPVAQAQIRAESQLWSHLSWGMRILSSRKQKLFSFELWKMKNHVLIS